MIFHTHTGILMHTYNTRCCRPVEWNYYKIYVSTYLTYYVDGQIRYIVFQMHISMYVFDARVFLYIARYCLQTRFYK